MSVNRKHIKPVKQNWYNCLWHIFAHNMWHSLQIHPNIASFRILFFSVAQQCNSGLDRPLFRFLDHTLTHTRPTSMPSAGFETAIPAIQRPQTHALKSMATGIGSKIYEISEHSEVPFWVWNVGGVHGVVKQKYQTSCDRSVCRDKQTWQSNSVVGQLSTRRKHSPYSWSA